MTETERPWYQDGCVVLCVLFIALTVGLPLGLQIRRESQEQQKPYVVPMLAGQLRQPLFGKPSFEVTVWHQHTGVLRNGRLTVSIAGVMLEGSDGPEDREHSFEVWQPNQENAVSLSWPLSHFDPEEEISVTLQLQARDIKPFHYRTAWQGDTWKSNQE